MIFYEIETSFGDYRTRWPLKYAESATELYAVENSTLHTGVQYGT